MADVIIPTWAEVNCWVALAIIGMAIFAYLWHKGKQQEANTITWIRDWRD